MTIADDDEQPVINAGQIFTIGEDATNGFSLGTIMATDTDAGTTFNDWMILTGNGDGIFDINPGTGELTVTDNTNLDRESNASITLGITVSDGTNTSSTESVLINVTDVNDELPVFVSGQVFTVTEGMTNGDFTGTILATDADITPAVFQNWEIMGGNISTDGDMASPFSIGTSNGELTINDTEDINSSLQRFSLRVIVGDGVNTSVEETVTINVIPINNAPSFTSGSDIVISEDAGNQEIVDMATNILAGPADETGQQLIFTVTNDANALFEVQPAINSNGTLTFTPAEDQFGAANVTVFLQEDGGTDNGGSDISPSQVFSITVNVVNDPPSFTMGADQVIKAGADDYLVSGWATNIKAGPDNESGQSLAFETSNNNMSLFSVAPSVAANGMLNYTIASGVSGTAIVSVILRDDGGTANGGKHTSDLSTFTVTIEKLPQVVVFEDLEDVRVGQDPLHLEAQGGASGQPVSFSIIAEPTTGVASLVDNTIIIGGPGTVIVTASQPGNDTFLAAADVTRSFDITSSELFLPTLFTPNNDGTNDHFIIRGGGNVATIELTIFDREGNEVSRSSNWDELNTGGWDGTAGRDEQPQGVYLWSLNGTSTFGEPVTINGEQSGLIRLV